MTAHQVAADAAMLDGVCVPAGTYNPETEDPRRPRLARQRKHATDLLIRLCQVYGIDYRTHPTGTPLPEALREDLKAALAMYGELVVDYVATRPRKGVQECPATPTAA